MIDITYIHITSTAIKSYHSSSLHSVIIMKMKTTRNNNNLENRTIYIGGSLT